MAVVGEAPLSVVIAGGGTEGHIFPAIALARALTKPSAGVAGGQADVRIVGRQGGPEGTTVRTQGIAFEGIDVLGFQRSVSPRNLLAAAKGAAATVRALRILRRARADVAVGTGAYVSIPVAMAAALLRIPLVLHEANAIPGVANRLAGRWAAAVAVSFPGTEAWFRAPVTLVGNPIRPEVAALDRLHRGGSGGVPGRGRDSVRDRFRRPARDRRPVSLRHRRPSAGKCSTSGRQ